MFDMAEEEYKTLLKEFDILTKQMEKISDVKGIDDEEPMTFPFNVTVSALREDEATTPLDRDEALKNAQSKQDGQVKLPKVVG